MLFNTKVERIRLDAIDIEEIGLMTEHEARCLSQKERKFHASWWLCNGTVVNAAGEITQNQNLNTKLGIRPVIEFSDDNTFIVGDKFKFGGEAWTVVLDGLAL